MEGANNKGLIPPWAFHVSVEFNYPCSFQFRIFYDELPLSVKKPLKSNTWLL